MKKLFEKDFFWLSAIILFSLLAIFPLFKGGFYPFHDEPHIANLYEMIRALSSGQIPPRWAPDFSFNYGHPFFIFYYPLPFYLGAFFYFVFGLSLIWSLKLVFLFSLPLSGIAFYYLMKKFFKQTTACAGAVIYMFTPYRAVDLYVRGAVGELWSFVFMPMVLLTLLALAERRTLKNILYSGSALAGLVLSHNITPVIFLPFALLFVGTFVLRNKDNKVASCLAVFSGLLAGLAMSAYYWLPLFIEKKYLQTGTPFNVIDHFPFIRQLILPSWGYGASVWGPGDGMSFQIGLVNLAVIVTAIFVCIKKDLVKGRKLLLISTLICFFVTVILMNIRSYFLWKILPLGDYIQFPWRLLIITTFFSSFFVGFTEKITVRKSVAFLPLGFAFFSIILTWNYFKPEKTLNVNDDYYLKRFFANVNSDGKTGDFSWQYLNFSEDYLPLTVWTSRRPMSLPENKLVVPGGEITLQELSAVKYLARIQTAKPQVALFNSYYFPGWKVWIDEKEVITAPDQPYGNISFLIPTGEHNIVIKFVRTPVRLFSEIISFSSLLILSALVLFRSFLLKK